jgi:hypothetical protein
MSWVMSTCMACIGVVLRSLNPTSLSGAPTRAMPPGESSEVAMLVLLAVWLIERGGTRCEARTRMLLGEAMHGESTQALSGASSAAGFEAEGPSQWPWTFGEALVCSRGTKDRTKDSLLGRPSDRSDCHSAVVPESSEQACTGTKVL